MNALAYVESVRTEYLETLRGTIRKCREEGDFLAAEIGVEAAVPGTVKLKTMRFDLLRGSRESPTVAVVVGGPQEGPQVGVVTAGVEASDGGGGGSIEVVIFPFSWEACRVWLRHPEPDWGALEGWFKKWLELEKTETDEDGLSGVVHDLSEPIAEGGGYLFDVDLGSAPMAAFMEMLGVLAEMGATEVHVGHSDGSDMDAGVAEELRSAGLTPERFTELVAEMLRDLEEVEGVTSTEPLVLHVREAGMTEPTVSDLHNLWLILQRTDEGHRPRFVRQFLRERRESHEFLKSGSKPDLSSLRPVIKSSGFIEHVKHMEAERAKKTGEGSKPAVFPLVCAPLTGDLWIACVWDRPNGMQFVLATEPEEFGLSQEETLARAVKNYLESHPGVETTEERGVMMLRTQDNYDASLLLDDAVWEGMGEKVAGAVLACVPTRDVVLVSGAGVEGGERALRALAREYAEGGNHPISITVLRREKHGWVVHVAGGDSGKGGEKRAWWKIW